MTSLAEVYEGKGTSLRRLYLGTGLFVAGSVMAVVAIVAATTEALAPLGVGTYASREIAGVLAGLGVPAVFVGIFTVLPASPRERAVAAVGASIAVFGVLLFVRAYPERWIGATGDHVTLPVVAVYFLGAITTFWALFTAVVNFKVRNDPGGTVTLQRIIERARADSSSGSSRPARTGGVGSVGVGGGLDRKAVESTPASDGGATGEVIRTPGPAESGSPEETADGPANDPVTGPADDAEMISEPEPASTTTPDRYCGNCGQFDYVRTGEGFQPYCGYFDELMDDMDPCDHWEPNA